MRPRATPGQQVSAGRLRVDAARAIVKLREYQLADRAAWVLEGIRAAVASGATRIFLDGDANDVWLSWQGEPWDAAELPRLFDELVSPEAAGERQHVRLLASAINSALGMAPAYVDVFAVTARGQGHRARYTPEVLVPPSEELGESPLQRMTVEEAAPPRGAGRGMAVHLRRPFGLEVLASLLRTPPELALARRACADLPVPIFLDGEELGRHLIGADVVRVELGADLDGFVAVCDVATPLRAALARSSSGGSPPDHASRSYEAAATLALAERGVVLAAALLPLGFTAHAPLPIRALLDAPRMPTNASRSQVRGEVHPIPAGARRAAELLPELVARLTEEIERGEPRARAAALLLLGATGERWSWSPPSVLRALGELPLVRDATGELGSVTRLWRPFVHDGKHPWPAELGAWATDVLWIPPGDPGELLVPPSAHDARAAREHLRWARREHSARARFFAHARRPPQVVPAVPSRLCVRLGAGVPGSCIDDGWFEGLTGEVCILPSSAEASDESSAADARQRSGSPPRPRSELVLLFDGRELERCELDSAIAFSAVVESPMFEPTEGYRAVARDLTFTRAERAVRGAVVRAMEALALAEAGEPIPAEGFTLGPSSDPEVHARSLRHAIALSGELGVTLRGPLLAARAWRSHDGRWVDLEQLSGSEGSAFGTAPPDRQLQLPPRRLVVVASAPEHRELVRLAATRGRQVVRYERTHVRALTPDELADQLLQSGHLFALTLRSTAGAVAIAPAGDSRLTLLHQGVRLVQRGYRSALGSFAIAVDAVDAVPDALWKAALVDGVSLEALHAWELELIRAAALTLLGRRPPELRGEVRLTLDGRLGRMLGAALDAGEPRALLGAELFAALRAAPLFPLLGGGPLRSAAQLAAQFPTSLPHVATTDPADPTVADFPVVFGDAPVVRVAAHLGAGQRLAEASAELAQRRAAAERDRRLAEHRVRPPAAREFPEEVPQLPLRSWLASGTVALQDAQTIAAALAAPATRGTPFWLTAQLLFEGRLLGTVRRLSAMPLQAILEVEAALLTPALAVEESLEAGLFTAIEKMAEPLLVVAVQQDTGALARRGAVRALFEACCEFALDPETEEQLAALATFPTLQGPPRPLTSAPGQLRFATWEGDWLPDDPVFDRTSDEADPAARTHPVFLVPPGDRELPKIFEELHPGPHQDLTERITQLQTRRRIARGQVARPTVPGVDASMKRRLEELGELGQQLAPGELALVDEFSSQLLLHAHGVLRLRVRLPDISPSVHLALEAPDLVAELSTRRGQEKAQLHLLGRLEGDRELLGRTQLLAHELVRQILATTAPAALPSGLLPRLRRLVFHRRSSPELAAAPLFVVVVGAGAGEDRAAGWATERELVAQIAQLGDVWVLLEVPESDRGARDVPPPTRPLDERRLVLSLSAEELRLARQHDWPLIEATLELTLDAQARANRARPRAAAPELPPGLPFLGQVALPGDGVTAARGVVAVLPAHCAEHRALHAHREMHRFAPLRDACAWPTVAFADDARLEPDRTWRSARPGAALVDLTVTVQQASEHILESLVRPPDRAIVALRIDAATSARLRTLRNSRAQLRGALWLALPPVAGAARGVGGVGGVHGMGGVSGVGAGSIELVAGQQRGSYTPPLAARGLEGALLAYLPDEDSMLRSPLDDVLGELCELAYAALLGQLEARTDLAPELIARLVASDAPSPVAPSSSPSPVSPAVAEPVHAPWPARPSHPFDPLVELLRQRLVTAGLPVTSFALAAGIAEPMVGIGSYVTLAADHPQLVAIATAVLARTEGHADAVDALAAHVVTLLNLAFTEVTDATEMHVLGQLLEARRDA